jgi:hypothetical protein
MRFTLQCGDLGSPHSEQIRASLSSVRSMLGSLRTLTLCAVTEGASAEEALISSGWSRLSQSDTSTQK